MKKVLSWLLLCAMLLALPLTVFAEDSSGGITIPVASSGFRNGTQFYMYDPNSYNGNSGNSLFCSDGEYISLNRDFYNIVTGAAVTDGILQYREAMSGDYELSFDVVLGSELKDRFYTMFYWQDYTTNGRSMQTSTRGTGFAIRTDIAEGGVLSFNLHQWEGAEGASTYGTAAENSAPVSNSTVLQGAQAGDSLTFYLQWKDQVLTVSVCLTDDPDVTTGDVIYDLSGADKYLDAVKDPAGFAIWMSPGAAGASESSSFGHFKLKDLSVADSAEKEIPIGKSGFLNGSTFYMYDPNAFDGNSGDALFNSDGTYFSLNQNFKNTVTGNNVNTGVLQSRQVINGDYRLSYEVVLNEEMKDRIYTMFYWQDYTENGRSMQTSGRGVGFALMTNIADGTLTFSVLKWNAADGASGGSVTTVAQGSAPASSTLLQDAAAGQALTFNLEWKDQVLTVSATKSDNAEATTGDVIFDLSGETTHLSAVKDPAGFAIQLAPADAGATTASKIGKFALEALVGEQIPADCWDYSALNPNSFATIENGDLFVRDEDGWFTRSDEVATDVGTVVYNKSVTYNYELSFNLKLNADNKGRFGIWNIWDGKFSGTHYGYMLVISTATDGTLEYRLAKYSPTYDLANDLATDETKENIQGSTILQDQPANAELLVKIVVQDQTLTVDTCLASDPSKAVGTVVYDLSGDSEQLLHRMADRTLGFALIDMGPSIDGGPGASASFGNVTYRILPGSAPEPDDEEDNNDYDAILNNENYDWSGDIACTEDNFSIYTMDGGPYELFKIDEDGWFYRTNENGDTTNKETGANAYAHAQYKGVMDSGDYRMTFSIRLNEENRCRVAVMTRWDDANNLSHLMMKSQTGFRIYFRVEEIDGKNVLQIVCYQSSSGYLPPMTATAENADSDILQGLTEGNAQLDITIVMKDDIIVAEAHLADDASKTTGPVAFNLKDNPDLLGKIDRTQGFLITDAACEYKIEPAAIGNIKLYAAKAPVVDENGDENQGNPDDDLPPVTTKEDDDEETPSGSDEQTGSSTTAPAEEEKGCKSSMTLSFTALAVIAVGAATVVARKKKSDE